MRFRAPFQKNAPTLLYNILKIFKRHITKHYDMLHFYVSNNPNDKKVILLLKTDEGTLKWTADAAEIFEGKFQLSREIDNQAIWFTVKVDLLLKAFSIYKNEVKNSIISLTSVDDIAYLSFKIQEKSSTSSEQKVPVSKVVDETIFEEITMEHPSEEWAQPIGLNGLIALPDIKEFKASVDQFANLNETISIVVFVKAKEAQLILSCENSFLELKSTFQSLAYHSFDDDVDTSNYEGRAKVCVKSRILQNFAILEIANPESISCTFCPPGLVFAASLNHNSHLTAWLPIQEVPEEDWVES